MLGEAHLLAGHLDEARSVFTEASAVAVLNGNTDTSVICDSELALLAADRGQWPEAAGRVERALATIDEHRMHDYVTCLLAFAGAARLAVHRGDLTEARRQLARAMRARPSATYAFPWAAVRLRLLPYLQTHLTAGGIAERLFVSSHTVKAEMKSIYHKLGVSSRNEAVQKATTVGLLGASPM